MPDDAISGVGRKRFATSARAIAELAAATWQHAKEFIVLVTKDTQDVETDHRQSRGSTNYHSRQPGPIGKNLWWMWNDAQAQGSATLPGCHEMTRDFVAN